MNGWRAALLLTALVATSDLTGAAGGAGSRPAQVFRAGTDVVRLSVSATDVRGHAVAGLDRDDFVVFEDGIRQPLSLFSRDPQPISLSLLIDTSTSMDVQLRMALDAAIGFCRRLAPGDIAQVITFDSDTRIVQPFTSDKAALEASITGIRTGGSTALYTALYVALNELNRARRDQRPDETRRQVIIVLSDGEDTTSLLRYDDVLDLARRSDVAVHAIGIREPEEPARRASFNEADFVLRSLAQSSGGRLFLVRQPSQLKAVYTEIADELASQYSLGYVSSNARHDGAWRQITVRVNQPNVVARTRTGYFAPSGSNP